MIECEYVLKIMTGARGINEQIVRTGHPDLRGMDFTRRRARELFSFVVRYDCVVSIYGCYLAQRLFKPSPKMCGTNPEPLPFLY